MGKSIAEKIMLSDFVLGTREELLKIRDNPEVRENPILELTELEFEVSVEFTKAGSAGLEFTIIKAGGSVESSRANKIRIKFKPINSDYIIYPEYRDTGSNNEKVLMDR